MREGHIELLLAARSLCPAGEDSRPVGNAREARERNEVLEYK
jgi:hypothetical protein